MEIIRPARAADPASADLARRETPPPGTRPGRLANEHECPVKVCHRCTPPTPGRPTRRTCPGCGSALLNRTGVYAVVPWRGDGRYTLADAAARYLRETPARARAAALGPSYVVRFLNVDTTTGGMS